MNMKVRTTERSPFGQQVITAARILGVSDQLDVVDTDFQDENDPLRIENPLGKMPVLTIENGQTIYDSRVIVEYLNDRFNGSLIPTDIDQKTKIKTLEALSDGITDAGVVTVMEHRMRPPEMVYEPWLDFQREKMIRGFKQLQNMDVDPTQLNIATISIGCLLRWMTKRDVLDLKHQADYFADWLERFESSLP